MSLQPEPWLQSWISPLLRRHPEIEQVYLLGNQARGPFGQKPNYSLLFYAGYDNALGLLMALAREEAALRTDEGILHLYVENYGATFCGIWGGALIPNELNRDWIEGADYHLWIDLSENSRPLSQRLLLPQERRKSDRRDTAENDSRFNDAFRQSQSAPVLPAKIANGREHTERRERQDRRREVWDLIPLLEE